ncbi:MAG: AAA family ATPase [Geminicoccaceae bacterium]
MTEQQQAEVLAFLLDGALGNGVERIDTHGAIVLLAGERAYKLKRAVRFSFMDFSTLDLREAALRSELELNRRTAPMLYRRVLPITREPDGSLALDGSGSPAEWLLEMSRFPESAQLDHVAARGELTANLVEALAATISEFHATAEIHRDRGGFAAMRDVVEGNAGDLTSLAPEVLDAKAVAALNRATSELLEASAALLERRRLAGRVRHCHGDLHLANIVLLDRRPVLFDCLEFDAALACIDVYYDLAFLVMDLIERGLTDRARLLLQTYGDSVQDDSGQALLPLFIAIRATIRAKVAGFNARVLEGEGRAEKVRDARAYLDLAHRALRPEPARLLVVAGRSGTGKSSVAAVLASGLGAMPGAVILRTDVIRKRLFGRHASERLPAEAYTPDVSARVFLTVAARARELTKAGRTVIADGVYGSPVQRAQIKAAARQAGVPFRAVWLEAPELVLERRVTERTGDASDADVAVVRNQARSLKDPSVTWPRVGAGRALAEVAADIRRIWEN